MGILATEAKDIEWVMHHVRIMKMVLQLEPQDEGLTIVDCDNKLEWLDKALKTAEAGQAAS